jgi:hypothetical protein
VELLAFLLEPLAQLAKEQSTSAEAGSEPNRAAKVRGSSNS